jgi:transcriptional regulator with XRE-family HTH domain
LGSGLVVGESLRRIRDRRRWTQEEMAHHLRQWGLDWSRAHLAAYEAGHRDGVDVAVVSLLSVALNVPLTELYPPFGERTGIEVRNRREADAALAKRLGRSADEVTATAQRLYGGRTLTEERDLRVAALSADEPPMGIGERQAHRGHVTRDLSREIEAALSDELQP